MEWYEDTAPLISLGILAAIFVLFAVIEVLVPRRAATQEKSRRWVTNLSLFALDTAIVRVAVPLLMIGTAILAAERGWGVFNQIGVAGWFAFAASILLLDFALFLQH